MDHIRRYQGEEWTAVGLIFDQQGGNDDHTGKNCRWGRNQTSFGLSDSFFKERHPRDVNHFYSASANGTDADAAECERVDGASQRQEHITINYELSYEVKFGQTGHGGDEVAEQLQEGERVEQNQVIDGLTSGRFFFEGFSDQALEQVLKDQHRAETNEPKYIFSIHLNAEFQAFVLSRTDKFCLKWCFIFAES